jgi:hypothetical protein
MVVASTLPTPEALREFLRARYRHDRFEGRDGPVWGANYSGLIIDGYMEILQATGSAWIGRHESNNGSAIKFDASLAILVDDSVRPAAAVSC